MLLLPGNPCNSLAKKSAIKSTAITKKPIPIKLVSNVIIPITAPPKHKNPPISSKSVTMNSIIGTMPDKNVLEK